MTFSAAHLKYLGGMLIPHVASYDVTVLPEAYPPAGAHGDSLGMGGKPFAIDTIRREFVMGTRFGRVSRIQIIEPKPHTGDDVNTFPTAPYVTATMVDLSGHSTREPHPPTVNKSWFEISNPYDVVNTGFGGCQPLGDMILLAGQSYYDANNLQCRSVALADWPAVPPADAYRPHRTPFRAVGEPSHQGLVAGYMAIIPEAWRARLKGDVLMGQAALPIITRGSAGPCAASFTAADVLEKDPVPMTLLVGYPSGHWMPGHPWDNPNADEVYNQGTMITGCAILGDTIVFVGAHGSGPPCYGYGTGDESLHGTTDPNGEMWCYDPAASAKANHAYPYRLQVWHYPLADLAAVAAGTKAPWDLVPSWFELTVPFKQATHQVNGCAFDPTTNRFYLCMYAADGYGYEPGPIIYAYEFDSDPDPTEPPPVDQDEQIERLQKTVVALTAAVGAERQRHAKTKSDIATEAEIIAAAVARILELTEPTMRRRP